MSTLPVQLLIAGCKQLKKDHANLSLFVCYSDSMLSRKFSSTFAEFTLAEFLSHFSLPVSLGDLKEMFENEVNFKT